MSIFDKNIKSIEETPPRLIICISRVDHFLKVPANRSICTVISLKTSVLLKYTDYSQSPKFKIVSLKETLEFPCWSLNIL